MYTLGRRSDSPDNSTKQPELFPTASKAGCTTQVFTPASPQPWSYWAAPIADQGYGATNEGTVGAFLEFSRTRKPTSPGMPLPARHACVNQASVDGTLEFIGEDVIKYTPRNETPRIKLGDSYSTSSASASRCRSTSTRLGKTAIDETIEVTVRNRKKTAAKVIAREYLYRWSGWTVTAKNREFIKRDAAIDRFPARHSGRRRSESHLIQFDTSGNGNVKPVGCGEPKANCNITASPLRRSSMLRFATLHTQPDGSSSPLRLSARSR